MGIWDERYCGIAYQEADYILRSAFHNPERSSINDQLHLRCLNQLPDMEGSPEVHYSSSWQENSVCARNRTPWEVYQPHRDSQRVASGPSKVVFDSKFNVERYPGLLPGGQAEHTYDAGPEVWGELILELKKSNESIYTGKLPTSMLYPYFEQDIPARGLKNYMN